MKKGPWGEHGIMEKLRSGINDQCGNEWIL